MASDDDFYILLVDNMVGDTGTEVIDMKDVSKHGHHIIDDIIKHFRVDIKEEIKIEYTSDAHDYESDESYNPDDYNYNSTDSDTDLHYSNIKKEKSVSDSHVDGPTNEESDNNGEDPRNYESDCNVDDPTNEELDVRGVTELNIEDFIDSISQINLDDENKTKVINYLKGMIEHAKASPPPLPCIPYNVVDNEYECMLCLHMTKTESKAIKHYRYKHGVAYHECLACHSSYRRRDTLLFHEQYCNNGESNLMRIARFMFNDKREEEKLRLKTLRKAAGGKYMKVPCRICSKLISRANMNVHVESHLQIKRHECTLCSARFRSKRALKSHTNHHSGAKPYQCTECPKAYSSYNGLLVHKQLHRNIFYECDVCKVRYVKKRSLLEHKKKHSEEEESEHLCTVCGEMIPSNIHMQIHLKKHRELPKRLQALKYKCRECPKICNTLATFKYHMKTQHNAEIYTRKKFLNMLPILNLVKEIKEEEEDNTICKTECS